MFFIVTQNIAHNSLNSLSPLLCYRPEIIRKTIDAIPRNPPYRFNLLVGPRHIRANLKILVRRGVILVVRRFVVIVTNGVILIVRRFVVIVTNVVVIVSNIVFRHFKTA